MNISEHLHKDYWVRRVTPDNSQMFASAGNQSGYRQPRAGSFGVGYRNITQDQFLNEINPAAHEINSKFMSQRPIYKPTDEKDKNGKQKYELVGFDEVETVALAIQEMIVSKKVTHLTGKHFWIANESDDEDAFENVRSWMDISGFWDGWAEAVRFCERNGDSALFLYQDGNGINYEVFAFEKGDTLYPGIDDNGMPCLYRQYTLNGKNAVDVFTVKYRETWAKVDAEDEKGKTWLEKVRAILKNEKSIREVSEDGYMRISRKESQVGNDLLQVIYFRVPDIATGPVQDSIEKYEKALSYVSEEVKNSAFPVLFLKSEKITTLPPSKINGKTIGVKGTSDSLQHSDAKFLAPPDMSNIAEINLNTLWNNILRGSMSALVEPEVLKQGSDSSTSIRILFAPDVQWCQNRWTYYAKPNRQCLEVFKRLVGKVEGEIQRYGDLRVSLGQEIWLPQNDSEELKRQLDMLYARAKSRKAVLQDIPDSHKGDYAQIMREWEEELELKQKYSASGQEEINPEEPQVTNQASGKSFMQ